MNASIENQLTLKEMIVKLKTINKYVIVRYLKLTKIIHKGAKKALPLVQKYLKSKKYLINRHLIEVQIMGSNSNYAHKTRAALIPQRLSFALQIRAIISQ